MTTTTMPPTATRVPASVKGAAAVLAVSAAASAGIGFLATTYGAVGIAALSFISAAIGVALIVGLVQGRRWAWSATVAYLLASVGIGFVFSGQATGVIGAVLVISLLRRPSAQAHLTR